MTDLLSLYGLSLPQQVAASLGHGRYEPVELLGAGGMAFVYKALDTRLDVMRAVKVLKPDLDEMARQRFFNEARTMAKLHHKNVVLVHDVADDGKSMYLVMELIEGGSIADRMAAFGPLPPRMASEVTLATLAGLGAAHAKGIVHRDVKPHNILVDSEGLPKVTDFGIAQASEVSNTRTGAVIGTWAYMAPEQRSDAKGVDLRADVYAVGCSLYNMLTGLDPFDLYNREIYTKLYADVPEVFRELIQKATRYDPDDRYPDTEAFAADLRAILADLPADPDDTPPLGVSLDGERAAIVPTMMAPTDPVGSSPTLHDRRERGPEDALTQGDPMVLLGAGGLVAVLLGLVVVGSVVAGLAAAGGTWFVFGNGAESDVAAVVEPAFVPEVPSLDAGELLSVERAEGPAPKAAPDSYVVAPPREPAAGRTYQIVFEVRPKGSKVEIARRYATDRWVGSLPHGRYQVNLVNDAKRKTRNLPFVVNSDKNVCFDLMTMAACN